MQHTKSFKSVNGSNLNEWYKTTLIHVRRNLDANSYRKGRRSKIYPSPEMKVISKDETVPGRKFIPEQDRSPKNAMTVHTELCTKRDGTRMVLQCSSSNVLDGGRQRTSRSCRSKFKSHCLMSKGQSVVRSRPGASSGWADPISSSTSSSSSGAAGSALRRA